MKRRIAGVAVMLCFALSVYAQCDSASGFMKQLCQAQTGNFTKMAPEAAVTTTLSDAIHGTTLPPSFNPPLFKDLSSLNRADSGAFVLKPGFYQMTAQSYAIGGSVNAGAGFYPAPIKGARAKAVGELLKNAELHSDLGQGDIQAVLNAILSGAALNSLPQRQQQAAATLLSADSLQQMRAGGQGGAIAGKVASLLQRHIPGAPPDTGACASLWSPTTSTAATRRSMRCDGAVADASSTFCSSTVRMGPASTTVPSTDRNNPSESLANSGAGAGCGCISPHHAPSSSHKTASGKLTIRCERSATAAHSATTRASSTSTTGGGSHTRLVTIIPAANSHAA